MGEKHAIGLDIGREAVKCVVMSTQKGRVQVTKCVSVRLEVRAEAEAGEWRAAAVKALKELWAQQGIPEGAVAVTAPTAHTLIRALKVATAKLDQQLTEEAKQQLPFPLEQLDWEAVVVGTEGDQTHVSLAAIKKEITAELLGMLEESGIRVERIESGALALANVALHAQGGSCGTPVGILSLGATAANLTIVDGKKVWMRTLPVAGSAVVAGLAKGLNITEAAARDELMGNLNLAEQVENESDAVKNVRATMMRLVMEITRSLTFYKSQLNGERPQKLLLTGGYSRIGGLREFLADRLKMPVEEFEVFEKVGGGERGEAMLYGEAVGSALAAAGLAVYQLNLMPKEIVAQRELDRKKPYVIAAAAILMLTFAGLYVLAQGEKSRLEKVAKEAQAAADKARRYDGEIRRVEEQMRLEDAKSLNLRRVLWERELYPYLLRQLAGVMPSNAWLYGVDTVTFGEVHEEKRQTTTGRDAERLVIVDDPELLGRPVRVIVRGGSYGDGAWTEQMPEVERRLRALPDIAGMEQKQLARHKKYAEFDVVVDLDFDRNGTGDYEDIVAEAASRPTRRR
ncbi:MAG: pilus assembly protein PilM [bacterium]|nr:pilus assembly protein PilM [bacterium]